MVKQDQIAGEGSNCIPGKGGRDQGTSFKGAGGRFCSGFDEVGGWDGDRGGGTWGRTKSSRM